jgi:hypothetical protein
VQYYIRAGAPGIPDTIIDLVGSMTGLQMVCLNNVAFDDIEDMEQFLKQIKEQKIPLRTFEFQSEYDDDLYMEESTNIDTKGPSPLQNLTSLAWCRSELYRGVKGNGTILSFANT